MNHYTGNDPALAGDELVIARFQRRLLGLFAGQQESVRLPVPGELGSGEIRHCQLLPGLRLLLIDCRLHVDFRVGCKLAQDLSELACVVEGSAGLQVTGEREHTAARGTGWLFCGRAGLSVAWIFPARQWVRQVAFFLSGQFLTRISAPIHARWPEIRPETGAWLPFCMQGDPRLGLISRALLDGDAGDPLQELEQAAQAQLGMLWMLQAGLRAGSNDPADAAVDRAVQTARIPPGEARKIHQARQILLREYAGPPTIAQLARRVSLNEFKLKQGYRRAFATSIYADLKQHRMQLARDLLLTGESSVAAVACAVGYSNPGHFARAFRERYGLNPGQLLRACPGHSI